jgi:hypothetical protein
MLFTITPIFWHVPDFNSILYLYNLVVVSGGMDGIHATIPPLPTLTRQYLMQQINE